MANAEIIPVGLGELDLIAALYNQIFSPPRDLESLQRRFEGRRNALILVAQLDRRPVGFHTGMELKPDTHFGWLCGVLPEFRRLGIGSQMMEAHEAWARQEGYEMIRIECYNRHRPMLHAAITHGYNIVGIRWDSQHQDNLVIFEKNFIEE
jgi:GNAT superfamily N-acetyltransferase